MTKIDLRATASAAATALALFATGAHATTPAAHDTGAKAATTAPATSAAEAATVGAVPPATDSAGDQTPSAASNDVVVVTGARVRASSQEELRRATKADIVTTGDISLQSNTSIADIARVLPGVAIGFEQRLSSQATGEGQYAQIRGFQAGLNAYTFDGLRLPQTLAADRSIPLNLFSPFAVSTLVLEKTPTSDYDSDSIAGILDLRTPTAFDYAKPFMRVRALGQLNTLARQRKVPGLGGAIGIDTAQRFGDNTGLYAAVYYEQRDVAAESNAIQRAWRPSTVTTLPTRDVEPLSPWGVQWNFFRNKIKRYGGTISLDHKLDKVELWARGNFARYEDQNSMDQMSMLNELFAGAGQIVPASYCTDPAKREGCQSLYDYATGQYRPLGIKPAYYFRTEDVAQQMISGQIGGRFSGDRVSGSLIGSYAEGRLDSPRRYQLAWRADVSYIGAPGDQFAPVTAPKTATEGLVLDLSDPKHPRPVLSPTAANYFANEAYKGFYQRYMYWGEEYLRENKWTVKGNLDFHNSDKTAVLSVGGLYETSKRRKWGIDSDGRGFDYAKYVGPATAGKVGPHISTIPGKYLTGFQGGLPPMPFFVIDRDAVEKIRGDVGLDKWTPSAAERFSAIDSLTQTGTETRLAAYAMGKFEITDDRLGTFEFLPGVRYEKNRFDARFFDLDIGSVIVNGAIKVDATPGYVPTRRKLDYDRFDPSIVANWRPDNKTVFRFAARSNYARPSFDSLFARSAFGNKDSLSLTLSNPNLRPVSAWNYDLGFEHHFSPDTYAQVALYYKKLQDQIVSTTTTLLLPNAKDPRIVETVKLSQLTNGDGATAKGIELSGRYKLSHLPAGWLNGFGVSANATFQDTEARYRRPDGKSETLALQNAPDVLYNLEGFYEGDQLRANINYTYTGRLLNSFGGSDPDLYLQPFTQLNAGVAYKLTSNFELGLTARNLLDSHAFWGTVGKGKARLGYDRAGSYVKVGRTFQASITAKF